MSLVEWLFSVARLFYDHHDRNRMLQSTIVNLTENLLFSKLIITQGTINYRTVNEMYLFVIKYPMNVLL